jgi:hypothetical protein
LNDTITIIELSKVDNNSEIWKKSLFLVKKKN